ncbi:Phosphatidylglycerol/phosphatidylinositol transfer protein [Apophysomyces sp. BC1034]|nr:Phosphatidylglycerol/phosphatidylinositol transfer protein [Apophysomyces sp. BC1015]KAG0181887.1 Phosphatidylglycerol/phosphatidylinositol transfer protein [Apophysomyces sp. BC1021]KAG0192640.1 Phosphatidylglycerol/phosphatidylinositol transfer protein [Apophysomyces sp. BC1034]
MLPSVFSLLLLLFSSVSARILTPGIFKRSTDLIEDCSDETYMVEIKNITLTPAFPEPGKDLLIEVEGELKERVEEGAEAQVTVKLGVVTLIRKTFDICKELKDNDFDVQCPISKGPLKITKTVKLPKEIPPGDFRVIVNAYNYDEADLACLRAHVDFRKKRPGLLRQD